MHFYPEKLECNLMKKYFLYVCFAQKIVIFVKISINGRLHARWQNSTCMYPTDLRTARKYCTFEGETELLNRFRDTIYGLTGSNTSSPDYPPRKVAKVKDVYPIYELASCLLPRVNTRNFCPPDTYPPFPE